ncbi:MAG: AAA family ATPase [Verrucomicrobiota bacterium]
MPFLNRVEYSDNSEAADYVSEIPAVEALRSNPIDLHPQVTFLVGENGSGKSTLLEGIADRWGFDREGGSRIRNLTYNEPWSGLGPALVLRRATASRPMDGYFLRAESFFNIATQIDEFEQEQFTATNYFSYGGKSLHQQSHGESFFALFNHRINGDGVYLLDEPEAALSPQRQLAFLVRMHDLIRDNSQFIIATHSPILLGYPGAKILQLDESGINEVTWEESDPYRITHQFLSGRERMLQALLEDDEDHSL